MLPRPLQLLCWQWGDICGVLLGLYLYLMELCEETLTAVRITRGDPDSVSGRNTYKTGCNQLRAMEKIKAESSNRDAVPPCGCLAAERNSLMKLWRSELLRHDWLLLLLP